MNRLIIANKGLRALSLAALGIALMLSSSALATPVFDTFGPFPNATFGGSGIPNNSVAASSQIVDGDVTITIAMSATQRFSNPALTNDGLGTYFAGTGSNFGGNNESAFEGALWNFNYYMEVEGANGATPQLTDYQIDLYYDFNTGADTPLGSLGKINITNSIAFSAAPSLTLLQDSQNLKFGFLAASIPGFITAPAGAFDANATGEYNFVITVSSGSLPVETVAMDVQVVPEPTTLALVAFGVCALGIRRRKSA